MFAATTLKKQLKDGAYEARLNEIYIDERLTESQMLRYVEAIERFEQLYGEKEIAVFSAPGRSEVSGNHTDHQHGCVLATSLNLDAIAIVAPIEEPVIYLVSDDFPKEEISLAELDVKEADYGTAAALIRGVAAGMKNCGYQIGGFEAYVTSDVLIGAGMSSSAAFESLIGTIFSGLYNDMQADPVEIAKIGQYAENVYFGKPCGLMDQMACSVGGLVWIDFQDVKKPVVKAVPADFEAQQYSLCIVDTKGSHADLTDDYAAIPAEMKQVAACFGREYLREIEKEQFLAAIGTLREQVSDRAILRAMHFFTEQERVAAAVQALEQDDFGTFLEMIRKSGDSSARLLQNIYSPKNPQVQNMTVALAASEAVLGSDGVCRVHGGGFAGTIQAFVKNAAVERYQVYMESIFGVGACHVLKVRPFGGIRVF